MIELIIILTILILFTISGVLSSYINKQYDDSLVRLVHLLAAIIVLIVFVAMDLIMRGSNFSDTEYLSYYYKKAIYEEPWNEYIHKMCTRTVGSGKTRRTVVYDCSYVRNHREKWILVDNIGKKHDVTKTKFKEVTNAWGGGKGIFKDMHRSYYTKDGDDYLWYWNNNWKSCKTFSKSHNYQNRLLGEETILRYDPINGKTAMKLGLYNYPSPNTSIKGYNPSALDLQKLRFFNGFFGKRKQIHLIIFVYHNKGVSLFEDQMRFFRGPNKNELLVGIFLDNQGNIIGSDVRSWQADPTLDVRLKNFILDQKNLDIGKIVDWTKDNIGLWKRREFTKDFGYISSYLTGSQTTLLTTISIILAIISCFAVQGLLSHLAESNWYRQYKRYH